MKKNYFFTGPSQKKRPAAGRKWLVPSAGLAADALGHSVAALSIRMIGFLKKIIG